MFGRKPKSILTFKSDTINYDQVSDLLAKLWQLLEEKGLENAEVKQIYSVVTEMLENIYRYSDTIKTKDNDSLMLSVFETKSKHYQIVLRNPAETDKATKLKEKIEFVNSLTKIGLKKLYQYEIVRRKDENHSGAGLGLIIIARKTIEPLKIELQKFNDNITLITLTAFMQI